MIVRNGVKPLVFREDECTVEISYDNRGEPYREGVQITFDRDDMKMAPIWALLSEAEARQLRDKLTEYLGEVAAAATEPTVDPDVFGQYDHLESATPVFGWLGLDHVCYTAVRANYGAVRLATALVRAIEARDAADSRPPSTLGAGLRKLIEHKAF